MLATRVAGTPSPFPAAAEPRTLEALEFGAALELVASHAVSELGAVTVRSRLPSCDTAWITEQLATAAEMQRLLDAGDQFRPEAVADIGPVIENLRVPGGVLEPGELTAIGAALGAMRSLRAELKRIGSAAPLVAGLLREIPPKDLEDRITRSFEVDGTVSDDASAELARARRNVRDTRSRLIATLERQLRSLARGGSHPEVTLKDGRYVIPVRRDDRDRIKGIVHGESASGATLFVEPPEAVELGNELSSWESAEARAVLAVLRDLTERTRPHCDALLDGLVMCARADDAYARARFAIEADGVAPSMVPSRRCSPGGSQQPDGSGDPAAGVRGSEGSMTIVRGVHPLLLAESDRAVPFDLELSPAEFTVLLSGPNAGGKTVLLKAVGLTAALAQSGVIPPVGKDTVLPVFRSIYVDIGDHQSIAASLSTFSAHVGALKEILLQADAGALVLLDEIGGGTDPIEGAALAGATLLSLNDRCSTTIATTHLSELKEMAARTEGVVNASLEFDTETLAPTYQFVKDRPGRSFGLAIARRMGLPAEVMELAEGLQPQQARSLEAMLADLERREQGVAQREQDVSLAEAQLTKARAEVESLRADLGLRHRRLAQRERDLERDGREQARSFLLDARRRVEEALGIARSAATQTAAKEARRLVEDGVRKEADALKRLEDQAQAKGWRVKRGGTGSGEQGAEPTVGGHESAPCSPLPAPDVEAATSEIDLRGLTGDEAEASLILALDAAIAADLPWLRIIHGKGAGVLRVRVGQVLRRDNRVARFHLAPPEQGGTGVTVVELAS
ncbi:MAG: Smr/MutS family protein [Gemmatimonadota bacterium]|nr:MAG: Smr/MutS family protein [Gemmatimonadota bacterium]